MKKLFAMLLAVAMVLSMFAACGNTQTTPETSAPAASSKETTPAQSDVEAPAEDPDDGEPYDVHIIYRIAPQDEAATKAVEDHINNDILPELLPNTTISFEFIPADNYIEQIKLKAASGEKMDLMLSMASFNFTDFVADGAFEPWDEYLDYLPNTLAVIPDGWLEGTTIGGHIYGIPNYQITARGMSVSLDEHMLEKYNINIDDINNLEDVEEKYLAVLAENGEYANGSISYEVPFVWTNSQAERFAYNGLEQINSLLVVETDEPTVVKNMFETEGALNNYEMIQRWTELGYRNADNLQGLDERTTVSQNYVGCRFDSYQPYWAAHQKTTYGRDFVTKLIDESIVTTASVRSTMTVLGYTTENPYRAAKVLDLINSNAELFNAICYGLEGVNYTWNDDGTVNPIADSGWAIYNWSYQYGNTMNQYRLAGKQEDYAEQVDSLNRSAKTGVIFGFAFNNANVTTEMASISAILDNYREGFNTGKFDDVPGTLDKMNQELYAAGLQTVLDEAQSQLDAWFASK